jgi:hypothetical protein
VPAYRHRVPAGMGLGVAPGRRCQPSISSLPPGWSHRMHPEPYYGMPKAALRQASISCIVVAESRPRTRKMSA